MDNSAKISKANKARIRARVSDFQNTGRILNKCESLINE